METFKLPKAVDFSSTHLSEDWKIFEQQLKNYLIASEKAEKGDVVKVAILLSALEAEDLKVYNTFKLPETATFIQVLTAVKEYCTPIENRIYNRYIFMTGDCDAR